MIFMGIARHMIHTPFLSGNCKLAEADAFVICGYLMMCIYGKAVFFQQRGDAMQKKTILKDAAGENYGRWSGFRAAH